MGLLGLCMSTQLQLMPQERQCHEPLPLSLLPVAQVVLAHQLRRGRGGAHHHSLVQTAISQQPPAAPATEAEQLQRGAGAKHLRACSSVMVARDTVIDLAVLEACGVTAVVLIGTVPGGLRCESIQMLVAAFLAQAGGTGQQFCGQTASLPARFG